MHVRSASFVSGDIFCPRLQFGCGEHVDPRYASLDWYVFAGHPSQAYVPVLLTFWPAAQPPNVVVVAVTVEVVTVVEVTVVVVAVVPGPLIIFNVSLTARRVFSGPVLKSTLELASTITVRDPDDTYLESCTSVQADAAFQLVVPVLQAILTALLPTRSSVNSEESSRSPACSTVSSAELTESRSVNLNVM